MHLKLNQSFPFHFLCIARKFCRKENMLKSLCCAVVGLDDCVLYNKETFLVLCQLTEKSFNDKNAMLPLYNLFSSTKKLSPLKFYTFLNLNTRSSSAIAYETKRSLDCLAFIQRTAL